MADIRPLVAGNWKMNGLKASAGELGRIMQGALESSNVEIVQEMVDMITSMRAYEVNSKSIQNSEQMLQIANGLVR